jgi:hypothetical protein
MSLLTAMPNPRYAAIKAANDPRGALSDVRIAADDLRQRIKMGEASETDILAGLLAIRTMAGGLG